MNQESMLRHFLAALAYRAQKALRGAPEDFGDFEAGNRVRTPKELVRHMTSVLGYARTHFRGGTYRPEPLPTLAAEVERFHEMLADLTHHLEIGDAPIDTTPNKLLQGPFSDAMTHAGQLAMLRRLHGSPVAPENFIVADIDAENVGPAQPKPRSPDPGWSGEVRPELLTAPSVIAATATDLPAVMRLVRACVEDMTRRGIDQWDEIYPARDRFEADLSAGNLYVARSHDQELVGIFTLNGVQDFEYEEVPWTILEGPVAVVHRLMVAPRAQGRGIAKRLMAAAEARASELDFAVMRLDAFTMNPRALQLYRGLGYHEAGEVVFRKGVFRCFEKKLPGSHA